MRLFGRVFRSTAALPLKGAVTLRPNLVLGKVFPRPDGSILSGGTVGQQQDGFFAESSFRWNIHWRNWKKGERGDSYEHHTFLQIASHLRSPFFLETGITFCIARHDEAIVNGHAHNDMALS